jgi:hypothetical protein
MLNLERSSNFQKLKHIGCVLVAGTVQIINSNSDYDRPYKKIINYAYEQSQ